MFELDSIPKEFFDSANATLLTGILRGIEREALRVSADGALAMSEHPKGLGSALTHSQITTDFSEALLEFITSPTHRSCELLSQLENIHVYTRSKIGDELLWTNSMPCGLVEDDKIPVANYGNSNNGKLKSIYRVGLGHRYGRSMQTVSGIHYNFSLPNAFWAHLLRQENSLSDLQDFKNDKYFGLIRNFRRHFWLLIYLFGASPAMCRSFVRDRNHALEVHNGDEHTLHLPYATSLRMGDLGYQSTAQESLYVCYNEQDTYIQTLCSAINKPHPAYAEMGLRDEQNNYKQLSTGLLQIENEFYSAIRPKRSTKPGETALSALDNRGVEYIEVRCLDINPFEATGISREQVHFLDTFLLYCALQDSPESDTKEFDLILSNQKKVVNEGRKPNLMLKSLEHGEISLHNWGMELCKAMQPVAELLDSACKCSSHTDALSNQANKLEDAELTPSATILRTLKEEKLSFAEFGLQLAKQHNQKLDQMKLKKSELERFEAMASQSLEEQRSKESVVSESFDDFLTEYYEQYDYCKEC